MAGTITLDFKAFMNGDIVNKNKRNIALLAKTAAGAHVFLIPYKALAATGAESTWNEIFDTVLSIADWLCVGIIVYAGVTWMFGNRTKAIEFLMGGSIGYLIIRHAEDIRDWLKSL